MYNVILVAYSEIGLKIHQVRRQMEHQLMRHIQNALMFSGLCHSTIRRIHGRLLLENLSSWETAAQITSQVFGVAAVMPAIHIPTNYHDIIENVIMVAEKVVQPCDTFAINAQRIGDHFFFK